MINSSLKSVDLEQGGIWGYLPSCYDHELFRRFSKWMVDTGNSLHQISKILHVKEMDLSRYVKGSANGSVVLKEIESAISAHFEQKDKKSVEETFVGDFAVTSPALEMWEAHQYALDTASMVAITGPSGMGKTRVNDAFLLKYPTTILVTSDITSRRPGNILRLIGTKMGAVCKNTSNSYVLDHIIARLEGSNRLLILDDSHFLTWEAFEAVRKIHDLAKIGVSFTAQPVLYDQMRGRNGYLFDQILSRLAMRRSVSEVKREDVRKIADSMCPGLDRDCIDFLFKKASGQGRFRLMTNILEFAVSKSKESGKSIDADFLKRATAFLRI